MIKNIAIIGIGGTGGYFGGKLALSFQNDPIKKIFFLTRGNHLKQIQENGLILNTVNEGNLICTPTQVTENFEILPKLDLCIICTKSFDLENVLEHLKNKVKPNTIIIPVLNGIDIFSRVKKCLNTGIVLPTCIYISAFIEKPGIVTQDGGSCKIILGDDPEKKINLESLLNLFKTANLNFEYSKKVISEIWEKFIFIASFGLVTACFDKTYGEIMSSPKLSLYLRKIINEIINLSKKLNINLPQDIAEKSYSKGKNFPYDATTSFQRDFKNKNKPDERDVFGKTIINMCNKYNINCDTIKRIYSRLENIKPA